VIEKEVPHGIGCLSIVKVVTMLSSQAAGTDAATGMYCHSKVVAVHGSLSRVDGRSLQQPNSWSAAGMSASVVHGINPAATTQEQLPGLPHLCLPPGWLRCCS
jgi:hypothetical protein